VPCLVLLLAAGCGGGSSTAPSSSDSGFSFWPFGSSDTERDRRPANATEYRCAGNRAFYVRRMEDNAVWLIAPDRELRLDKQADGRYGVGRVSLELGTDGSATLTDPPNSLVGCSSKK
jgi:hypothetical protein